MNALKGKKINRVGRTPIRKGDVIFYVVLLIIPISQILIFYFGVNFQSFLLAFQKWDNNTGALVFDPSENFGKFAADIQTPIFWTYIKNSFLVYLFTSLTGTVLATLFSYYIYKRRTLYNFFKFALFLPSLLPAIMLVIMFKQFVGNGVPTYLNYFFGINFSQMEGGGNIFLKENTATFIIITIYSIWVSFGAQVLVYTGAMDQISPEVIEAGKLDGTNSFTEFIHIILPSIAATLGTFLIVGIASIFTNQNNLYSFYGGGGPSNQYTVGYYVYLLLADGEKNYPYAAFIGLACTLIVLPLTFGVRKLVNRVTR